MEKLLNYLGEWNPQLFREVKGRLKPKNIIITSAISVIGQVMIYLYYQAALPVTENYPNRYCVGKPPQDLYGDYNNCVKDLLGNWMIIDELWWLDLFICLSIIGIFALLVVGSYLLISDLAKEEKRGTLNFIRLSPQSAIDIFIGKILGVPILLYLVGLLAFPLHLVSGLKAGIPLTLIVVFYAVLALSCLVFYSAALLYGLTSSTLGGFQPWLGSGAILFFLFSTTPYILGGYYSPMNNPLDWLLFFNPTIVLTYLVNSTFLPPATVNYLDIAGLKDITWYGTKLWSNAFSGISFMLVNLGIWSYWNFVGLKRSFHNRLVTLLSKKQSYWLTSTFVIINLGFTNLITVDYLRETNFLILQFFNLILFGILVASLSPQRQTLQDWARYRHKVSKENRGIIKDLLWGEKSPSTLAIAVNLAIVTLATIPLILLAPENKNTMLLSLIFTANLILIYAIVYQLVLFAKIRQRAVSAYSAVGLLFFLPIFAWIGASLSNHQPEWIWLFSIFSVGVIPEISQTTIFLSLIAEWLGITLVTMQMTRILKKAGKSETAKILPQTTI